MWATFCYTVSFKVSFPLFDLLLDWIFFNSMYFGLCHAFTATCRLSLVGVSRGCSSCSAWASHCGGLSCHGARALGCMGPRSCGTGSQQLRLMGSGAHRLTCPAACGIHLPRPEIEPVSPALAGGVLTTGPPEKS